MGLRERKKEETRIALSWAAIKLTAERGFDNVKVEDIAAEAGVSHRTFNNYFSSKGEAIAARHFDRAAQIADELRSRPDDEPLWEAITNAVFARLALGVRTPERPADERWIAGIKVITEHPEYRGEFLKAHMAAVDALAVAVAERTGTDADRDLYPRLVAGTVGTALLAAIHLWLHGDARAPFEELLRDALGQVAAGLPTP
ncbi:TetR family transcriptional regulator [Sphaerisporangium krabiense]|uniref:AcrR family transcriptional regulator n=1 Tax=Sphaerisporangium krabiense TaxID=763782 RepID=A0A7W8Z0N3_9ACTN|nr:TetR family transcriptional regulator [Sphaerisporangium krabiense]MBB5625256.1 AcrR family transcriptional regulator [Sphaerisporangium krabiense]GII64231.1 TetR family transcriptional regulator [Sphaerisporangium krabiense]